MTFPLSVSLTLTLTSTRRSSHWPHSSPIFLPRPSSSTWIKTRLRIRLHIRVKLWACSGLWSWQTISSSPSIPPKSSFTWLPIICMGNGHIFSRSSLIIVHHCDDTCLSSLPCQFLAWNFPQFQNPSEKERLYCGRVGWSMVRSKVYKVHNFTVLWDRPEYQCH